jgi:hypothetical protein
VTVVEAQPITVTARAKRHIMIGLTNFICDSPPTLECGIIDPNGFVGTSEAVRLPVCDIALRQLNAIAPQN